MAELGKDEFAVWDGTRRVKALKGMGKAGSVTVPALITTGTDSDSVIAQININQNRERLNSFAEVEALRQLIQDHNMNQREACKVLLKSESWASKVMRIYGLPEGILEDFRNGDIILSQIIVLTKYIDNAKILNFLHREALKETSAENLKALAIKSESFIAFVLIFFGSDT